jgi:hypothetical protein
LAIIVSIPKQRVFVYRNGIQIAVSPCSTGKKGHETPTGVFTILQKEKDHHSNIYDNAPMPFMERLTWNGVALHAGNLPGYPASHGCIRLPAAFATKLYEITQVGTPVIIAGDHTQPASVIDPGLILGAKANQELAKANSLKAGDQVSIDGYRSKDGSNTCNARMVKLPDGRRVIWANRRSRLVDIQTQQWASNTNFTASNYQNVLLGQQFTYTQADGTTKTEQGEDMSKAFINSLTVTIPATVIPILVATFAAYAFAWMRFPGRKFLFAMVVGLLVIPGQVALIPLLRGLSDRRGAAPSARRSRIRR